MASLHPASVYSSKRVMGFPALPFTTVEEDPYIAPVLKVPAQFLVSVQAAAGDYEEEQVSDLGISSLAELRSVGAGARCRSRPRRGPPCCSSLP
jgi:hypothetical protein